MPLNVLSIGGSRDIGYLTAVRFLDAGCTVTFLLRSPDIFDSDEFIQKYLKSGKAKTLKGDALVKDDVKRAWDEAAKSKQVDLLLFTVGGTPSFSLCKGFQITPANLVTQSFLNILRTMPKMDELQPRIIIVSSAGVTRASYAMLPVALKPLYKYLIAIPGKDKHGLERLISYFTGWPWDVELEDEPTEDIVGNHNWRDEPELPAPGSVKKLLVLRPALLTDGECKTKYRASQTDFGG